MNLSDTEWDKIDVLFNKFEDCCKPKQNMTVKRYHFNTRVQNREETIEKYVTELQLHNCKISSFGELKDNLIRDRIICGVNSEDVKCHKTLI